MDKRSKWLNIKAVFVCAFLITFIIFLTNAEPYVRSDGYYYFHTTQCLINENNFACTEKPEYWGNMDSYTRNEYQGKYVSVTSPGTAILNTPLLILANLAGKIVDLNNQYFLAYNGHTLWQGLVIVLNSIIFAFLSLVLIYKALRHLGFSEKVSLLSVSASYLSSYAIWYVFLLPIFTHTYEIFAVSLCLFSFLKAKKNPKYLYLLGSAIGVLVLLRPVLIAIGLFFIIPLVLKKDVKSLIKIVIGGIPFAVIYFIYNLQSYGSLIASGYDTVRSETFNFQIFNGFNLLFSSGHGWLIFSPLMILGILGLVFGLKKMREISLISLISILAMVVIYGFWPAWSGGGSFGSRFMIFAVPFISIGVAILLSNQKKIFYQKIILRKLVLVLVILTTFFTLTITALYRVVRVNSDNFTPADFIKGELEYAKKSNSIMDLLSINAKNIQGGSGLLALATGISNEVLQVQQTASGFSFNLYEPFYLRRSMPDKVEFILYVRNTNQFYYGTYNNPAIKDVIEFICNDSVCSSNNLKVELVKTSDLFTEIKVGEYIGITSDGNFKIFFKDVENMQFSGNRLDWKPEEGVYKL